MASQSAATPRLVVIEGKDKGKIISLKKGTAILGRSKGDILVQDPRVSRSHVALHFDHSKGELSYTDLKSLNGVLVNGELKETGLLQDGDKLQLGNTIFDCQMSVESETEAGTRVKAQLNQEEPDSESRPIQEPQREPQLEGTSNSFHMEPAPAASSMMDLTDRTPPGITLPAQAGQRKNAGTAVKTKSIFFRLPKPVRIGALTLCLVVFVVGVLVKPSPSRTPDSGNDMEKEIATIRKLLEEKKWAEAQKSGLALTTNYASHSLSFLTLGDVYAQVKKTDLSLEAYKHAHTLLPTQPVLHAKLVRTYLSLDLVKDAEEEMKHLFDVLKTGPKESDIYIKIAELYLDFPQLKTEPEKVLVLARALENSIAPESTVGYKLEANLLLNEKSPQAVPRLIETLERGLKVNAKDEWLLEKMVFARLSQSDTKSAVEGVDGWMKVHPGSTKPMLIAAYLKFNDKNYLGAVPYLQKVIQALNQDENNPHYSEALHLMGQIYFLQNQLADAESFLKQACKYGFQDSCNHPLVAGSAKSNGSGGGPRPASEKNGH